MGSYNRLMPLECLNLPADSSFWSAAGHAVHAFAARCGVPERQLGAITWLVPSGTQAVLARTALHAAHGRSAFIPPRIAPLPAWLGRPMGAAMAARAEIYSALRASAWVRDAFGDQSATLWSLARDVAQLGDELTWAAVGSPEALEGRLTASLARHFHRRAAHALRPQAQLVLQLWRARRARDAAAAAWSELDARASRADAPLVYLSQIASAPMPDDGLAPWERAFLQRWAGRAPVLLLVPDVSAALRAYPMLAAAWPELIAADERPIAQRADALRGAVGVQPTLTIVAADSLEDEATAVARQVMSWRREGIESIGLVTLDRLTARRVRALLERAQISARDETGWKLSTTSAAAAVMRWYDLVADDLYWRDLLDWLKSNFTLAERGDKAQVINALERAIRHEGAVQGVRAMRLALAERGRASSPEQVAGACDVLELLEAQVQAARRSEPTLAAHARALKAALAALGMRAPLAADVVGREVLREIDALEHELAAVTGRARLEEFRALLAARFEEASYVDREVDSTVTMVTLSAASLRTFERAILIGADAQHLPTAAGELLFFTSDVRAELGLATSDDALRAQAGSLAALLAGTPQVVATWRRRHGDEANALSPLLERLRFVAARATGDDLVRTPEREAHVVEKMAVERPAPSAGALLPARLSASHAQSLVDCPYQFYARRLLRLDPLDDVTEAPGKREFGEALHEVLRRFHVEWDATDFSAVPLDPVRASLARHAREVFGRAEARMPGLLAFERRFLGLVDDYVDWLQRHSADGWRWSLAEHAASRALKLDDGRAVELIGRLDRVDRHGDGVTLILDYKARAASDLKKKLKSAGEDVQLPFYGLLLRGVAAGPLDAAYVAFDRGRLDRSGVQTVPPPQPFEALVDDIGARLAHDLQRIADDVPLPALGGPAVCDHCEMRGLCRRDFWEHGGEDGEADDE
jgi:ATP-dependent helicase/nuclease subunit B